MGWASGFASGVMLGNNAIGQYRTAEDVARRDAIDRELQGIAAARLGVMDGAPTAAPDGAVQAQLDSGAGVGEARQLAQGPRAAPTYNFLGKDYAAAPDEATQNRARQLAMAGVFEKYGDVARGMGMRREVRLDDAADQRMKWEGEDRAYVAKQRKAEEAYAADRQAAFNNTTFGQRNAAYAQAMDKYQAEKAAYDAAVESGKTPPIAPTKPAPPSTSWGEALLDHATMLATDIKHGRADTAAMVKFAELQKAVQDEGYLKNLTLAQSGAPLTQVIAGFNAQGNIKIDPAAIVSDKMVDRGGGVKSRIVTFKGPDGSTQTIDTLAELDALGKADKVFARAYAANADQRAGAASRRAQAEFDAGAGERRAKGALGALQAELLDPKTTSARAQEISGRIAALNGVMGKAGEQPAQVKLAQAIVNAGLRPDMKSALEFAMTAKDKSPEALRAELLKTALTANMGDAKRAKETVDDLMDYMKSSEGGTAPGAKPATQAEAHARAKDVIAKGASKDAVNAQLKKDGFEPVP